MARITEEVFARPIRPSPKPVHDGSDEELLDWQKVRRYALLSIGSVRRRLLLFVFVSAGMVLLAAGALSVMPKTYEVQARLLAQRNPVLTVRADSNQMEPTRAAVETITSRENLRALIEQTDLLQEWPKRRAPVLRLKDRVMQALGRVQTDEELEKGLVGLLEKNLNVWTTPQGMVGINLLWPDPLMAYRLVDAAQQNFLEKRHVLEISTIAEQISILEGHAARLKKDIDAQVAELQRLRNRTSKAERPLAPLPAPKPLDAESPNIRVLLEAKRRAITDLEEFRQKHLIELQTRLTEQRAVYSENHPVVLDLQRSIELLRHESPQLAMLKQEAAELRARLATRGEEETGSTGAPPNLAAEIFRDLSTGEDASVEYARSQLRYAAQQYAAVRDRIEAGHIDLDTARAAFKYRYSVVVPPELPRGPIKPRSIPAIVAALVAGLLLALFATTAADLRTGVVLERWQIEDLLPRPMAIVDVPWTHVGRLPPAGAQES
jgi:hypothetical protein